MKRKCFFGQFCVYTIDIWSHSIEHRIVDKNSSRTAGQFFEQAYCTCKTVVRILFRRSNWHLKINSMQRTVHEYFTTIWKHFLASSSTGFSSKHVPLDVVYLDATNSVEFTCVTFYTYLSLVFNNKSYESVKLIIRITSRQVNDRRMLQECHKVAALVQSYTRI